MTDPIAELRMAVNELLRSSDSSEASGFELGLDPLDDMLVAFFASEPASDTFAAGLLELAASEADVEVRPGRAAAQAAAPQRAVAVSVEDALGLPTGAARSALVRSLGLNADAADEFLERPAAALAQRGPAQVRHLATLVGRPAAELYLAIAESWRSTAGFAYPYRPGVAPEEPAAVPEGAGLGPLIDWGVELLLEDSAAAG